jgi:SAM-dependent methyltransferase
MQWAIERQVRLLSPFLRQGSTFLEVGAGDCALSAAVASILSKGYAVDVSEEITRGLTLPANVEVRISDGTSIPVPPATVDVAYSNQLMEHLHPDDALEQVHNIYAALRPAGIYICITPNRLSGPHDISKYFDELATGFHLKEYTVGELDRLFERVGFGKRRVFVGGRGKYAEAPIWPIRSLEAALAVLPAPARRVLADRFFVSGLLGIRIIGTK